MNVLEVNKVDRVATNEPTGRVMLVLKPMQCFQNSCPLTSRVSCSGKLQGYVQHFLGITSQGMASQITCPLRSMCN